MCTVRDQTRRGLRKRCPSAKQTLPINATMKAKTFMAVSQRPVVSVQDDFISF